MKSLEQEKVAKKFGMFIRERRENMGLRQEDAAKQIGVSRGFYSHLENGNRSFDLAMAFKICRALGLSMSDFEKLLMEDIK